MQENNDYWKELLGDGYTDEVKKIISGDDPDPAEGGDEGPEPGSDPFYTFDPETGGKAAPKEPPKPPADEPDARQFYTLNLDSGSAPEKSAAQAGSDDEALDRGSDNFRVNFDFDEEYRDVPENRPLRQRREKRTGCLGGILYAAFIIAISILLACVGWIAATDVLGLGGENGKAQVAIPADYAIDQVADLLRDAKLIKYPFLFKIYSGFSKADEKIAPGTYELDLNYDYRALVYGMSARSNERVQVKVSIPEGYTLKQIFTLFEESGVCTEADLWDAAENFDFQYDFLDSETLGERYRLEGYLFPDTYYFYVGDTAVRAIDRLLSNFKTKFTEEFYAQAAALGYTPREILIIASMIEKEAGTDGERDLIASVIYNRLSSSSFPRLQIDATIFYAIAETGESFSTDLDSPYNTYVQEGLPIGPIANPGLASIRAALYPQSTNYYYYALKKAGDHAFFRNYDAFINFVNSDEYGGNQG